MNWLAHYEKTGQLKRYCFEWFMMTTVDRTKEEIEEALEEALETQHKTNKALYKRIEGNESQYKKLDAKINDQKKFEKKYTRLCAISLVLGTINIVILLLLVFFLATFQQSGQIFQSFLPVIP